MHKDTILAAISAVLDGTNENDSPRLIQMLNRADRVFVAGVGRSGLVARFFAMRLMHTGYRVNIVGEVVTPAIKRGDLLLVISGSGGTKTLIPVVETAKKAGAVVCLVSMRKQSPMAELAEQVIQIGDDTAGDAPRAMPMGTRFELSSLLYLESVVAEIVDQHDLTEEGMRERHANLE